MNAPEQVRRVAFVIEGVFVLDGDGLLWFDDDGAYETLVVEELLEVLAEVDWEPIGDESERTARRIRITVEEL